MEYNVVSIGEKLKKFREKYSLNQDEIVGTDVTRNLISQIENNKVKLTRSTAEIVLRHAREKLKQKNIIIDEDIEYLLESEEAQARKILDRFIEKLKELAKSKAEAYLESLQEAEEFLLRWNLTDKKIIIYEITGDYFYSIKNFYKASLYYENAKCLMNFHIEIDSLISLLQKLSNTYYFMGKLKEGIDTCNYALNRFPEMVNEKRVGFLFNIGLYYNYLHDYQNSIKFINQVVSMLNKTAKGYAQILLLKASTLCSLKFYEEALDIYNELLQMTAADDYAHKALYYNNICETYIELKQYNISKKYLDLALKNLTLVDKKYILLPNIYFDIAKLYVKLRDLEKSIIFFKEALNLSREHKNSLVIKDIFKEIVHIIDDDMGQDMRDEFKQQIISSNTLESMLLVDVLE